MKLSLEDFHGKIPLSKKHTLNVALATQIDIFCDMDMDRRLKVGDRYEAFFAEVESSTRIYRQRRTKDGRATTPAERSEDRMKRLRKGEGGIRFAEAIYYWFHTSDGLETMTEKIDADVFGVPYCEWASSQNWFRPTDQVFIDKSHSERPPYRTSNDAKNDPSDLFQNLETISRAFDTLEARGILNIELLKLFLNDHSERKFFYKLDYTDSYQSFKFDPDDFRFSMDENLLDGLLIKLSGVGRLLSLGIIDRGDIAWMRNILTLVIQNSEVIEYFRWLKSEHELPDHSDFHDAIALYGVLIGKDEFYQSAVEAYGT